MLPRSPPATPHGAPLACASPPQGAYLPVSPTAAPDQPPRPHPSSKLAPALLCSALLCSAPLCLAWLCFARLRAHERGSRAGAAAAAHPTHAQGGGQRVSRPRWGNKTFLSTKVKHKTHFKRPYFILFHVIAPKSAPSPPSEWLTSLGGGGPNATHNPHPQRRRAAPTQGVEP